MGLSGSGLLAPRSRKHSSACRCDQISGEFSLLGLELEKEKDEEEVEEEVKMEMREGGFHVSASGFARDNSARQIYTIK